MFGITPYSTYRGGYNPFRELEKLERQLFPENTGLSTFKTDIKDNGDSYLLEAELPGFKKDQIHVDVADGTLTISAERQEEKEEKDKAGKLIHSERFYGSFERSFDLSAVNEEGITAEYTDGVLRLTLPKKTKTPPASRRLEIGG